MTSLSSLGSLLGIGIFAVVAIPILLGVIFVILVVANRSEPDPTGRRPAVVYMLGTAFVTLFVTLFATFVAVAELFSLVGTRTGGGGSQHPVGDAVARGVVISLLVAITAGAMLYVHLRGAVRQAADGVGSAAGPVGPVGRVWQSYDAAVSFVCVLITIVATVVAVYQLFKLAGPGVFSPGSSNRVAAVRILFPSLYIAGASVVILLSHQRIVGPLRDMGITGPLRTPEAATGD